MGSTEGLGCGEGATDREIKVQDHVIIATENFQRSARGRPEEDLERRDESAG